MNYLKNILGTVILLTFPIIVQGALIPSERIGNAYNDGWWYQATSTYIGPGNRGGTALGFRLSEGYRLIVLKGFVDGVGDPNGYGYVAMSLHKGSKFGHDNIGPLPSDNVIFSSTYDAVALNNGAVATNSYEPRLDLEAGDYWLVFQSGTPLNVGTLRARGYELEGENLSNIHAPEPMTFLLFGGGLLAMRKFNKRKLVS